MTLPTPEERGKAIAATYRKAFRREASLAEMNIADAIAQTIRADRQALLSPSEDVIEAMARRAYEKGTTDSWNTKSPLFKLHLCEEQRAALAVLKELCGVV